MQFRAGDKIRCIENGNLYGELKLGNIYTVSVAVGDMVILKEKTPYIHKNQLFSQFRFEHAKD